MLYIVRTNPSLAEDRNNYVTLLAPLCSDYHSTESYSIRFTVRFMTQQSSQRGFKRIKFYLPEDGIYCAAQEALPRFRRQEFGSEDRHELVEIDLSITWHNETKKEIMDLLELLIVNDTLTSRGSSPINPNQSCNKQATVLVFALYPSPL